MKEKYFYGYKVSDYGLEKGYVDYRTFAKAIGDMIICDISKILNFDYMEEHNLYIENEDGEMEEKEIFTWYIVNSDNHTQCLLDEYGECWIYDEKTDLTFWGIDHWGTSWDYVLTDIKLIEEGEKNE